VLERARLFEEVRGVGDDLELDLRAMSPQPRHGVAIHLDNRLVVTAYDEQRRSVNVVQTIPREVWTSAA
jgi:hypothetical protein